MDEQLNDEQRPTKRLNKTCRTYEMAMDCCRPVGCLFAKEE